MKYEKRRLRNERSRQKSVRLSVFVPLGLAPRIIVLFGDTDLLAALWTALALRTSVKTQVRSVAAIKN
jgi:hypothetical protein